MADGLMLIYHEVRYFCCCGFGTASFWFLGRFRRL